MEGLEEYGIVLDSAKNEKNEGDISRGKVKILVVPTNEELAIARDTKRILAAMDKAEAPKPAEAETKRPVVFRPEETARLVLLWAQNPKAAPRPSRPN